MCKYRQPTAEKLDVDIDLTFYRQVEILRSTCMPDCRHDCRYRRPYLHVQTDMYVRLTLCCSPYFCEAQNLQKTLGTTRPKGQRASRVLRHLCGVLGFAKSCNKLLNHIKMLSSWVCRWAIFNDVGQLTLRSAKRRNGVLLCLGDPGISGRKSC